MGSEPQHFCFEHELDTATRDALHVLLGAVFTDENEPRIYNKLAPDCVIVIRVGDGAGAHRAIVHRCASTVETSAAWITNTITDALVQIGANVVA